MIEDLLLLARSDADAPDRRSEPVDLDDIVLDEIRAVGPLRDRRSTPAGFRRPRFSAIPTSSAASCAT